MFNPAILAQYLYRRVECQALAVDACVDTAEFYGLAPMDVAQFLRTIGIDTNRLALL
jgi:hypothetical protein